MKQFFIGMKQLYILMAISFIVCIAALPTSAEAASFNYYGISIDIENNRLIHNEINLEFDNSITQLEYGLDFKIQNLEAKANFNGSNCRIVDTDKGSTIACEFTEFAEEKRFLRLFFETSSGVQRIKNHYLFSASYNIPVSVDDIVIKLQLPENAALIEVFPDNPSTASYNNTITLLWDKEDLTNDDLSFSVKYSIPVLSEEFYMFFIITITLIIIIVMISMILYVRRGSKKTPTKDEERVDPVKVVASVLREDEKKIIDVLEKHEGKVIQKVLVRETDFSKAKVSRLVKNLKERGIINVEPIGRTTKVSMKIKPVISSTEEEIKNESEKGVSGDETNNKI